MEILFLGTGAADWPAEDPGTGEFRRLSSALLDGTLLIDPGPCVPEALARFAQGMPAPRYMINTHRHSDHFCPDTVEKLSASGTEFVEMAAGDTKVLGRYTVRAFRANHATCPDPVHFLIDDGDRRLYYALDGAWLLYEEYQAIREFRPHLVVLDATIGDVPGDYRIFEHNNLTMVREMRRTLAPYAERFCISHMARTLHRDHASLSECMAPDGIIAAHDGMRLQV